MSARWSVVIPVKGGPAAKSRLGATAELALAIALDTVEAALGATLVGEVVVVTDAGNAAPFGSLGARCVADPGGGLARAIEAGLEAVGDDVDRAVLLGDHPALEPGELDQALRAAATVDLGFVGDADGTGTAMVTARARAQLEPAFGAASRAAHEALGLVELSGDWPGLAADVDTEADLAAVAEWLGPRTWAIVSAAS